MYDLFPYVLGPIDCVLHILLMNGNISLKFIEVFDDDDVEFVARKNQQSIYFVGNVDYFILLVHCTFNMDKYQLSEEIRNTLEWQ